MREFLFSNLRISRLASFVAAFNQVDRLRLTTDVTDVDVVDVVDAVDVLRGLATKLLGIELKSIFLGKSEIFEKLFQASFCCLMPLRQQTWAIFCIKLLNE